MGAFTLLIGSSQTGSCRTRARFHWCLYRKINFSTVFGGQLNGIREVADGVWLVSFRDYDLGFFDNHENTVEPWVKTHLLLKCYLCGRNGPT